MQMALLKYVSLKITPAQHGTTAIIIRATLSKMQLVKARNHHHITVYLMNKLECS